MYAPVQLKQLINSKRFNYKELKSQIASSRKGGTCDLCFYVPVRNRQHFFKPFYNYFQEARKNTELRVKLVFIENDVSPNYSSLVKDKDIEYIFIPSEVTKSDGIFAKSLCYNMGFIFNSRTKYHVFHDLDILIDPYYFKLLEIYIRKGFTWLQPYQQKRVMRIGGGATKRIIENPEKLLMLPSIKDMRPADPGSPGGSILVKREDFINIGGYDPELFFGYGPEDSFFWSKLEILHGADAIPFKNHFQGKGVYADNPPMDVYHLDHPIAVNQNPYYCKMLELLSSFYMFNTVNRFEIINLKKQILEDSIR